jgi:hypothetical protein
MSTSTTLPTKPILVLPPPSSTETAATTTAALSGILDDVVDEGEDFAKHKELLARVGIEEYKDQDPKQRNSGGSGNSAVTGIVRWLSVRYM